jgi:hypothetical protein
MACVLCDYYESRVDELERLHAQALGILVYYVTRGDGPDLRRLRITEAEARLEVQLAQNMLAAHKRQHTLKN